jgi:hypothetical protein
MKKRFGPAKAEKAERLVTHLKGQYGEKSGRPFAIATATMAGTRKLGKK